MPVYRDKARSCFVFEFDREIAGRRIRARKVLPKTWNKTQADAYDRTHSARLYVIATGVQRPQHLIEEAVIVYLTERVPQLKTGHHIEGELLLMYWAYSSKDLGELPEVCKLYVDKACKDNGGTLAPATLRNRIRYLTSACRWAWKRHAMCQHDPAARVVVPIVSNQRHDTASRQMLQLARA